MSTNFWSYSVLVLGFGSILELENKLNIFDRSQCELSLLLLNLLTRYFGDKCIEFSPSCSVCDPYAFSLYSLLYTLLQLVLVSSDSHTFLWAKSFNMDALAMKLWVHLLLHTSCSASAKTVNNFNKDERYVLMLSKPVCIQGLDDISKPQGERGRKLTGKRTTSWKTLMRA